MGQLSKLPIFNDLILEPTKKAIFNLIRSTYSFRFHKLSGLQLIKAFLHLHIVEYVHFKQAPFLWNEPRYLVFIFFKTFKRMCHFQALYVSLDEAWTYTNFKLNHTSSIFPKIVHSFGIYQQVHFSHLLKVLVFPSWERAKSFKGFLELLTYSSWKYIDKLFRLIQVYLLYVLWCRTKDLLQNNITTI